MPCPIKAISSTLRCIPCQSKMLFEARRSAANQIYPGESDRDPSWVDGTLGTTVAFKVAIRFDATTARLCCWRTERADVVKMRGAVSKLHGRCAAGNARRAAQRRNKQDGHGRW